MSSRHLEHLLICLSAILLGLIARENFYDLRSTNIISVVIIQAQIKCNKFLSLSLSLIYMSNSPNMTTLQSLGDCIDSLEKNREEIEAKIQT